MKTSETKLVGRLLAFLVAGVLGIGWAAPNAEAIPAFARRENMACTNCHTAWPRLNAFGRRYKENGYQVMRGQPSDHMDISKKLSLPKTVPFSAVINSRPYDKKKNGPAKLRALHEAEFFLGGNFMGWGSVFAEAELEDEKDFTFELAHAVGGLHFNQYINVLAGKASAFHMDPYDTLSNRHFSRSRHLIGDSEVLFGAAGPLAPAHETQTVQVYGRAGGLFYGAGLSADGVEGDGTDDYTARLAYDVMKKELTIGSFLFDGSTSSGNGASTCRDSAGCSTTTPAMRTRVTACPVPPTATTTTCTSARPS